MRGQGVLFGIGLTIGCAALFGQDLPLVETRCVDRTLSDGVVMIEGHCSREEEGEVVEVSIHNRHREEDARVVAVTIDFCGRPDDLNAPAGWTVSHFTIPTGTYSRVYWNVDKERGSARTAPGVGSGETLKGFSLRFSGNWRYSCNVSYRVEGEDINGGAVVGCSHDCEIPEQK